MSAKVIAENRALVVREGNLDRHRVPADILASAEALYDSGDGINWQVQDFGPQGKLIVGTVVKNARSLPEFARKPPTPPARAAAPAGTKQAAKKSSKKAQTAAAPLPGGAAVPVGGMGSMFVAVPQAAAAPPDDDDYLDDGPLPPMGAAVPVAPVPRATAPVPQQAPAPAPTAKGGKKGGGAKKGAVAYQVPGQPAGGGIGSMFG